MTIHFYNSILTLSIILFSCATSPENCGSGYTEVIGECYNDDDLAVLQAFIDNTSVSIPADWDVDSDNSIHPLEYGIQEWHNGRLTLLDIYDYDYIVNPDTIKGEIPENIGDLKQLKKMNLAVHEIKGEIPESIGKLENLQFLYLYHNKLSGNLPENICNIYPNLSNFWIEYNSLCPPYPDCIPEEEIDPQNTSECQ